MTLSLQQFNDIMEEYAPPYLKESYDNVGLMVGDINSSITSILLALDCTLEVIEEAIEKNCNLIVTHHPLLFLKPQSITTDTLLGRKTIKLIKNNINVYSCHTNLDVVKGGLNDIVTQLLGFSNFQVIESSSHQSASKDEGIGRMAKLDNSCTLKELCESIKSKLNISHVRYAGDLEMVINNVAIINGSGEDFFYSAVKKGADCIITGDTSYHYVSDYKEMGLAIIDAGHFETEWAPMKIVANILNEKIKNLGYNNLIFISEKCESPYKFI